jgi:hypothetical protein
LSSKIEASKLALVTCFIEINLFQNKEIKMGRRRVALDQGGDVGAQVLPALLPLLSTLVGLLSCLHGHPKLLMCSRKTMTQESWKELFQMPC